LFYGADYLVKPDNDKVIAFTDKKTVIPAQSDTGIPDKGGTL